MRTRIPIHYILGKMRPTWADLRFGLERGFINETDVVEAAVEQLSENPDATPAEIELAGLLKNEVNRASLVLNQLVPTSGTADTIVTKKWLYLILAWLYDQRESLDDPLGAVEEVYADFGYPEEMVGFVRYMPPRDEYRPQDHSREENISRLFRLWNEYLAAHERKGLT